VVSEARGNDLNLALLDMSGHVEHLPARAGDQIDPEWTADGCCIAFATSHGGKFPNVFVTPVNGKRTFKMGPGITPAWSPDGSSLALALATGIIVIPTDGPVRRLTNRPFDLEPTWSPDGKRIAFRRGRSGQDAEIYVINADGTGLRRLTHTSGTAAAPAWSPS